MVELKQLILPGDEGADVLAVKHTLRTMGVAGSAAMSMSHKAGPAFVATVKEVQRKGAILVDGKYGKDTHALVAPNFSAADQQLYLSAKIRSPQASGSAAKNAKRLLALMAQGKYHADSPGDLNDIKAAAAGQAVKSGSGQMVHIDERVFRVLVHMIERGHTIGTSAICSDHHDDGPNGHAGGKAVDISTIDGKSLASASARAVVLQLDKELQAPGNLHPRQLITGGVGGVRDQEISKFSIPDADKFFGSDTMQAHTNHIHVGY